MFFLLKHFSGELSQESSESKSTSLRDLLADLLRFTSRFGLAVTGLRTLTVVGPTKLDVLMSGRFEIGGVLACSASFSGSGDPSSSSVVSLFGRVGDSPFSIPLSLPSVSEVDSDLHRSSWLSSISDSTRDSVQLSVSSTLQRK